jgi:hypothetical protein
MFASTRAQQGFLNLLLCAKYPITFILLDNIIYEILSQGIFRLVCNAIDHLGKNTVFIKKIRSANE